MNILLGLLGIIFSFLMIHKREMFGNMFGETEWMTKVGGIYYVIVYVAIFIFIFSVAMMFGLTGSIFEAMLKPVMPWLFSKESLPIQ